MRFARLLIVGLLVMSGVAFGGEKDGPYVLVYRQHVDYSITTGSLVQCMGSNCNYQYEHSDPIAVESYPTLEKVLERLNDRKGRDVMDQHPERPTIGLNDFVLLIKGKRINPVLAESGQKVQVSHNVWKTEDIPVQEWDVPQ